MDGQDARTCSSISRSVEDSTLQHSGDVREDSHVLALRKDDIRSSDDLPLGVDMASRKSCMEDDELPMMSEPHFSSSRTTMIAMTHEDISGISKESCVRVAHHEHIDPQTQEERHDLETVYLTHTYHYKESESFFWRFHR